MGLTPEELAQLEAVVDADDFDALLAQFYSEGKITLEEGYALQDKYAVPQQTTPQLDMAARLGMLRQPSVGAGVKPVAQGSAPLPGEATSTIGPIYSQFLNNPYLLAYTSPADLADRLYALLGDVPEAGQLYGAILGLKGVAPDSPEAKMNALLGGTAKTQADLDRTNQMAIRAAGARAETAEEKLWASQPNEAAEQSLDEQTRGIRDLIVRRDWEEQYAKTQEKEAKEAEIALLNAPKIQAAKNLYLPGLRQYLDSAVKNGTITQAEADNQFNLESSFIDKGYDLQDLPNYASLEGMGLIQTPEQAMGKKAQAEVDIINQAAQAGRDREANRRLALNTLINRSQEEGYNQVLDETRRRNVVTAAENARPEQPSYGSAAEPYLATLPPNLRAFIQSVILPRVAEETAGARAEWWKRKNPVAAMAEPADRPVPQYQDLLAGARSTAELALEEVQRLGPAGANILEQTRISDVSQKRLADLLALGQEGYFAQQRAIPRGTVAAPLTPKPTTAEDPFLARLKQGNEGEWLAEFLMQAPEQRGYNKRRFAPRVRIRGY